MLVYIIGEILIYPAFPLYEEHSPQAQKRKSHIRLSNEHSGSQFSADANLNGGEQQTLVRHNNAIGGISLVPYREIIYHQDKQGNTGKGERDNYLPSSTLLSSSR